MNSAPGIDSRLTDAPCRFVARFGSARGHPAAESVRRWHDELSRGDGQLPLV